MQRLQCHDELCGRAIRIGDDVLLRVAGDVVRIHLRHHQRDIGVVPIGRGVVDHDASLGGHLRRPLLGDRGSCRKECKIGLGEIVLLEIADLQRLVTEGHLAADRAARSERHHLRDRKTSFCENGQHFLPDIAGRTDDGDGIRHGLSPELPALRRRVSIAARGGLSTNRRKSVRHTPAVYPGLLRSRRCNVDAIWRIRDMASVIQIAEPSNPSSPKV